MNATIKEKLNKLIINDKEFEQMGWFTYLGSIVTKDGGGDEDVRSRIKKANGVLFNYTLHGEIKTSQ
jgi:hypothetical protein